MPAWLNRTVIGAGLTSFLADVGYELAKALIPGFLYLLGLPVGYAAQVAGWIESSAEFVSNAAKLLVGWWSDKVGKRKRLVVFGYALTGSAFALCALAFSWPLILFAQCLAWLGKGIRGPLRNAILADSVAPQALGKAFGFHRAGDTLGAVVGPLLGIVFLRLLPAGWFPDYPKAAFRAAFVFTLVPGLLAAVAFWALVREQRFTPKPGLRLGASVAALPRPYWWFLVPVGIFGLGDFAHTILFVVATAQFSTAYGLQDGLTIGILLPAWRNLIQALFAFPAGVVGDRIGHGAALTGGYALGAMTFSWFVTVPNPGLAAWLLLFALAGIFLAVEESLEPAAIANLVPDKRMQGTAFGVLAVVNGLGDVVASAIVGWLLYHSGRSTALTYAAITMLIGALMMAGQTRPRRL
ncbi:MAG TPA: MFS transporter [Fimbriiglobus sp.]|jgi:MFS family permease